MRSYLRILASIVLLAGCAPDGDADGERLGEAQSAEVKCPDGPTVEGIDVSSYQPNTNWKKVKESGREFAFIKATEGTGYVNPYFDQDWQATKNEGILRGAYHFFHPETDAVAQANHFVKTVGALDFDDLPCVLDLEITGGVSASTVAQRAKTFLKTVEELTGKRPILYTYVSYWSSTVGSPDGFDDYPLWIANYGVNCPTVPGDWKKWPLWQYTSSGGVPGVAGANVDQNVFNGTLDELRAFASGGSPKLSQIGGNDSISLVNWSSDRHTELFVTDTKGSVLRTATDKATDTWSELDSIGDDARCGLAASMAPPPNGAGHVFAPSADGATLHFESADGAWGSADDFGGEELSHLSTLVWPDGHLEVFALGADGSVAHRVSDAKDGTWSEWEPQGGEGFVTGASAILWGDGHAEIFATDDAGSAWHDWSGDFAKGWHGWEKLDGEVASRPVPVRWPDGHVEVFARSPEGGLVHATFDEDWSAWEAIGEPADLVGEPSVIIDDGGPEIVARDSEGRVLHLWWLGDGYGSWSPHLDQRVASDPFLWVRGDGRPEIFAIDTSGQLVRSYHDAEGWKAWEAIGGEDLEPCLDGGGGPGGDPGESTGGSGGGAAGGGAIPEGTAPASESDDSGCAFRASPRTSTDGWAALATLVALGFWRGRRRREPRPTAARAVGCVAVALAFVGCAFSETIPDEVPPVGAGGGGGASAGEGGEDSSGSGGSGDSGGASDGSGGSGTGGEPSTGGTECDLGVTCVTELPFHDERDTTKEGSKLYDIYECKPSANESGPEIIYRVAVARAGKLTATIVDGDGVDIDIHILSSLEDGACLARGDLTATADVEPSEVYVVADTYVSGGSAQAGSFTLDIEITP